MPEAVIRAAPSVVEPDAPDRPVENDVITEREIARSIRSYEFFEWSRQQRVKSRETRL